MIWNPARGLTKSERTPPNVSKLIGTVSFVSSKISMKQSIRRMCFACVYDQVQVFEKKVKNTSGSRSWYQMKGRARRNTHVKYESSTTHRSKVITKVKVFEKKIKIMVLPKGIHMWNMKALAPINQKLWPRLKLLKSRSNSKVQGQRIKVMVSNERSWQKEYTCEIWIP